MRTFPNVFWIESVVRISETSVSTGLILPTENEYVHQFISYSQSFFQRDNSDPVAENLY